jgi:mycofactocin precursor
MTVTEIAPGPQAAPTGDLPAADPTGDPAAADPPTADATGGTPDPVVADDELIEEDLLVEEISIDGMCGVY